MKHCALKVKLCKGFRKNKVQWGECRRRHVRHEVHMRDREKYAKCFAEELRGSKFSRRTRTGTVILKFT